MAITSSYARSYLRSAMGSATALAITLEAKLKSLNSAAIAETGTGKVLNQTAGNGRSAAFAVNATEGATPTEIAELTERLLTLHEEAVADGQATDALRFAWMMDALKPVRSVRTTFATQIHR